MRVLYVSKALVVAAYRDKLRALAHHCDVSAVVPHAWNGHRVEPAGHEGVPIRLERAYLHGHNHLHVYRGAAEFLSRARPDLVHIDEEPYSAVTAQLAWLCRRRGIPCVFFAWQNIEKRIPPPFGALRDYVFRSAAGGIAGTDSAAAVLRAWGWAGPVAVIPQFGVNVERFRPDPAARRDARAQARIEADAFVVGYAGRLVVEKGVHDLLAAMTALPSARLVFVGDGPERAALEASVRQRRMSGRVSFLGAVPSRDVPLWLNAFDVLVLPSFRTRGWMEQFGRVLGEAMACGVAVVGTRSGEIPDVIGDAGVVVTERDVAGLSAALARLADRADERATLAGRGRRRVLDRYTQAHITEATARFYRSIVAAA